MKTYYSVFLKLLFFILSSFNLNAQTLVAHYPFSGNALDVSGNGNHGIPDGATLTTDRNGISNEAYFFDGIDDAIYYSNIQNFHPNFPLTVAVWVYITKPGFNPIFINDYEEGKYYGIGLNIAWDNLSISYGDGGESIEAHRRSKVGTTVLDINTWYHVAAVIRGPEDMSLFLNGVDDCGEYSGEGGSFAYQGNNGRSGVNQSNPRLYFDGKMDDLRLYEGELSREEIAQLAEWGDYDLSEGLVAHYPFDGSVIDGSGNSNHGTLQNGASFGNDRKGNDNGALKLDGTNDYIRLEANDELKPNIPATISCWIYLNDYESNSIFRNDFQLGAYYGMYLVIQNGFPVLSFGNGTTTSQNGRRSLWGDYRLDLNKWYHISAVFRNTNSESETQILLYINGQYQCGTYDGTATSMIYSNGDVGDIGRSVIEPTEYFHGSIDELRVYNRALASNEIKLLAEESICGTFGCGEIPLGIHSPEVSKDSYKIFPNPNDGTFSLEILDSKITKVNIQIFNIHGQLVWKERVFGTSNKHMNLSHLGSGVYFFRSESNQQIFTHKIVINR